MREHELAAYYAAGKAIHWYPPGEMRFEAPVRMTATDAHNVDVALSDREADYGGPHTLARRSGRPSGFGGWWVRRDDGSHVLVADTGECVYACQHLTRRARRIARSRYGWFVARQRRQEDTADDRMRQLTDAIAQDAARMQGIQRILQLQS